MAENLGRVFMTGGSGFVGGRMISLLREHRTEVRALARSAASAAKVAHLGAEPAHGDLSSVAALTQHLAGCRTVLHVAGHLREWDSPAAFGVANVDATRVVLEASRTAGVQAFVQVGAAAVVMGEPMPLLNADERLPLQSPSWAPYIATKAEAERLVLVANSPAMRTCVVRPPFIWGLGSPMLDNIAKAAEAGQFRLVDGGVQAMSTCHVDNVCEGTFLAAERGRGGEAYFLADAEDSTLRRVMTELLFTRGLDAGRKDIGFRTAWRMCSILEPIWRATMGYRRSPPITRQVLRMAAQPFTISTAKARADLDYNPRVSWADGIRDLAAARQIRPTREFGQLDRIPGAPESRP